MPLIDTTKIFRILVFFCYSIIVIDGLKLIPITERPKEHQNKTKPSKKPIKELFVPQSGSVTTKKPKLPKRTPKAPPAGVHDVSGLKISTKKPKLFKKPPKESHLGLVYFQEMFGYKKRKIAKRKKTNRLIGGEYFEDVFNDRYLGTYEYFSPLSLAVNEDNVRCHLAKS